MKRLLIIFVLLLLSVGLGVQLNKDPGYVLVAVNQWTVETPLWFALLGLFILFFFFYYLLNCLKAISQTKPTWQQWRKQRQKNRARKRTRQGLIEFTEGNWQNAESHLVSGLNKNEVPLINYLTAAKAAQEQGNNKQRDYYLREAQQSMPEAKIAVELTQAQLQIANKQWEQALATLKHLQQLAPKHPYVLKLLMNLHSLVKDWQQLIELLPVLKRHKVIDNEEIQQLELQAYLGLLDNPNPLSEQHLNQFIKQLAKPLRTQPELVEKLAERYNDIDRHDLAEELIKSSLKRQWSEALIHRYGLSRAEDIQKQLDFAESLLKKHPLSANLNLTLGRLCAQSQLWGKARKYLEKSIEIRPSAASYCELGKLLDTLNESECAKTHYKKGLNLALIQMPET